MRFLFGLFLFIAPCSSFSQSLQDIDIDLLQTINSSGTPLLDEGFKFISNTTTPVAFAIPVGVLVTGIFEKNKKIRRIKENNALQIGISLVAAAGITEGLKLVIDRPRPFETYPYIIKKSDAGSPSFPSGHTTLAFAAATSFSLCYPKWYIIVPSYLWAGSVAYSRMYLGVHYPSDVLAGMIIGSGTAIAVYKIRQGIYHRGHDYNNMVPKF